MSSPVASPPTDLAIASDVATVVRNGTWTSLASGPWSRVWQVAFADGRPRLVVKAPAVDPRGEDAAGHIAAEAQRLAWVGAPASAAAVPVPEVVVFANGPRPVLVTTFLPGEADLRLLGSSERAVGLLGRTLAALHRLDPEGCPFDASAEARLAVVEARVASGLVHTDDLQPALQRFSPERLLEHLRVMAPDGTPPADRVLLHGDLCVTNVLFDPATEQTTAVLDWGRCGVGDRHADLAVTARSVVRNFGGEALPDFFAAYGDLHPDPLRLEFYALVEELS